MNPLPSSDVNDLLARAGRGSTVFLVGAGGCGMSGLGHLLLDLGHAVAGSDLVMNDDIRELNARGARIEIGHDAARVRSARPVLAVYSSAIRANNPELTEAQAMQVPIVRRAVLLAALLHRQRGVCVAGMHGKTTTSALLAYALDRLGAKPSFAVGWRVPQLPRHARFVDAGAATDPGQPPLFVIEADESDGTLREFNPEHAIVLNVDAEHLDYYANLDAVCTAFDQFAGQTRGRLVFCADDVRLAELFSRRPAAVSYGFNALAVYRAVLLDAGTSGTTVATRFEVWHQGARLGEFRLRLYGEQNVANATSVVALLHQLGFAAPDIGAAIEQFAGAARRQQELFADTRFRVFDDYGHHPAEIRATLKAFRTRGPRRLLVAFQPHRFTRTQHLLEEFVTAFHDADRLWLTEIYAASEPGIPGVNSERLAEAIRASGQKVDVIADPGRLCGAVRAELQAGDWVVFLGAGADITVAAHQLAQQLGQEVPAVSEALLAELAATLSRDSVLRRDEPLARRTTMRVGGKADLFVEPASESDLAAVLRFCQVRAIPFVLLGRGSNLLIRDGGIRGVVISLSLPVFSGVEVRGGQLICGAGAPLKAVANEARRHGLGGLEFLEGIPGSVGGALRMNAGAMGGWIFDIVETIRFMDHAGRVHERRASEVNVEYRGCPLFKNHIALGAVLNGEPAAREAIERRMAAGTQKRRSSQPRKPSAGCIFKNPESIPAGRLIDELGLKGTRVGGAVVSDVHSNFIVNDGNATAGDVLALIDIIQQRAKSARGIELETEVEILGEA